MQQSKPMQNQGQYTYYPTNTNPGQLKMQKANSLNSPNIPEKTLFSATNKSYSINSTAPVQLNTRRSSNPSKIETTNNNSTFLNKIIDLKNPPNNFYYPYRGNSENSSREQRGKVMAKSMIIGENQKVDSPEEPISLKTQITKRMMKRPSRMTEVADDQSPKLFQIKKQQLFHQQPTSFYKNKETVKEQRVQQKQKEYKQPPAFLNRANDMKRSLFVESALQTNRSSQFQVSKEPIKTQRKKVSSNDFQKIKQLGNGKYGRVYMVRQRSTNFICALKVIQKKLIHEEEITDQFLREVKIQMFLNHPNIIKMYGCFDDKNNIYIILEVGTGGQLYHLLEQSRPLAQPKIAHIMKQVCEAVKEIHSLRIIHRDIKPENIVIHDNIIKLCDFGWSVHQDNKLRTTFCGTPLYVCPQILKGREYDQKIDIWSIGIMMYEMAVGQNPFKITKQEELIKIVKDEIKIPASMSVSLEVRDFLDRCLQKNPNDRSSIKELINHAFFKKHQEKGDKPKLINL